MKANIVNLIPIFYNIAHAKERATNMAKKDFYTEIDGNKLMAELKKRNLYANEVSEEMGHDRTYISTIVKNGKMHNSDLTLLKYMYNIQKDDIIPIKEEVKNEPAFEKTETNDLVIKGKDFLAGSLEPTEPAPETNTVKPLTFADEFWMKLEETMYNAFWRALSE